MFFLEDLSKQNIESNEKYLRFIFSKMSLIKQLLRDQLSFSFLTWYSLSFDLLLWLFFHHKREGNIRFDTKYIPENSSTWVYQLFNTFTTWPRRRFLYRFPNVSLFFLLFRKFDKLKYKFCLFAYNL